MKTALVTGGTIFVSRAIAQSMINHGYQTYVLNRNTKQQLKDVHLIQADRYHLDQQLSGIHFDVVVDIAYNGEEVRQLLDHLASFDDYFLISSSAVYPDTESQPFSEETSLGNNTYWGKYGTDKIEAEQVLLSRVPHAYILRPPYLYGPGNNIYREAFVFECALQGRPFYLPGNGDMPLQFFHIDDLCTLTHTLLNQHPQQHIFNIGNENTITIREWVQLCYQTAGYTPQFIHVHSTIP